MKIRWQSGWQSKAHPYWFVRRYPGGTWTFQCMGLNVWGRN